MASVSASFESNNLVIPDQEELKPTIEKGVEMISLVSNGVCAICLDDIELQETALIKGCEHAYCVNCILQWATYYEHPKCPQCKMPFTFLSVHRSLDGNLHDYMFEESVCLLLRASWFKPLDVEHHPEFYNDPDDIFYIQYPQYLDEYEDIDEDLEDSFFHTSSSLRIGNRRWGDNGYVSAGRLEARPIHRSNPQNSGSSRSSHHRKQKEVEKGVGSSDSPQKDENTKDPIGRRAKRALKREAADKAAAAKHEKHLLRLGRK